MNTGITYMLILFVPRNFWKTSELFTGHIHHIKKKKLSLLHLGYLDLTDFSGEKWIHVSDHSVPIKSFSKHMLPALIKMYFNVCCNFVLFKYSETCSFKRFAR